MSEITSTPANPPAAPAPSSEAVAPVAQAPAAPAIGGGAADYWTAGLTPELQALVQKKAFASPAAALEAYRNLESHLGVPEERILKIPKAEDTDAWGKVWAKLGRPEAPEGYGVKPPEGKDPAPYNELAKAFHEVGLSKRQVETLMARFTERDTAAASAASAANEAAMAALKTEWGDQYETKVETARKASRAFLPDKADPVWGALEAALGPRATVEFFHRIGAGMGSAAFVAPGSTTPGPNGFATPQAAQSRINELIQDQGFQAKIASGDKDALRQWRELNERAAAYTPTA